MAQYLTSRPVFKILNYQTLNWVTIMCLTHYLIDAEDRNGESDEHGPCSPEVYRIVEDKGKEREYL